MRADAIIATGRSDYPNQVNNVLCFPYIFRGALDVGATTINEEMKIAARARHRRAARRPSSPRSWPRPTAAQTCSFGPEYLIPKPFDPRLIVEHRAGGGRRPPWTSGVATRPIADLRRLSRAAQPVRLSRPALIMRPMFARRQAAPRKRVVYAEGEDERVLRAVQVVVDERLPQPILIGRPEVIGRAHRAVRPAPRSRAATSRSSIPDDDPRYRDVLADAITSMTRAQGRHRAHGAQSRCASPTLIGAMLLHKGDADGMLCGTYGALPRPICSHVGKVDRAQRAGVKTYAAMNVLILPTRTLFICRHLRQLRPDRRDSWPRSPCWRPTRCCASACSRRWRCCRIRASAARQRPRRVKMRGGAGAARSSARRSSRSTARCTATPRSIEGIRDGVFPDSRLQGEANLLVCRTSTPPTSPSTCSRRRPATASRSARCCSARPSRCTS